MLLAFADETSDSRYRDYFGLSLAVINASFYPNVKREAQHILLRGGWDPAIEFKGSVLFSASKGCTTVPVEKRIEMTSALLELNVANQNRRMKFYYVRMSSTNHKNDYLTYLPLLVKKGISRPASGPGKDLIYLTCDQRPDISASDVHSVVAPAIEQRGYVLLEHVSVANSCFHTIGLLYADIIGYLVSRIDTIRLDADLFDDIPADCFESDGRVKKLISSTKLVSKIKRLSLFEVKEKHSKR